jgi:hypothetical protein
MGKAYLGGRQGRVLNERHGHDEMRDHWPRRLIRIVTGRKWMNNGEIVRMIVLYPVRYVTRHVQGWAV